jgi:hypothetical protein
MNHVMLDAADAVELIEILEYFIEAIDRVIAHRHAPRDFAACCPYGISDLRADITRLADRLNRSPLTP